MILFGNGKELCLKSQLGGYEFREYEPKDFRLEPDVTFEASQRAKSKEGEESSLIAWLLALSSWPVALRVSLFAPG